MRPSDSDVRVAPASGEVYESFKATILRYMDSIRSNVFSYEDHELKKIHSDIKKFFSAVEANDSLTIEQKQHLVNMGVDKSFESNLYYSMLEPSNLENMTPLLSSGIEAKRGELVAKIVANKTEAVMQIIDKYQDKPQADFAKIRGEIFDEIVVLARDVRLNDAERYTIIGEISNNLQASEAHRRSYEAIFPYLRVMHDDFYTAACIADGARNVVDDEVLNGLADGFWVSMKQSIDNSRFYSSDEQLHCVALTIKFLNNPLMPLAFRVDELRKFLDNEENMRFAGSELRDSLESLLKLYQDIARDERRFEEASYATNKALEILHQGIFLHPFPEAGKFQDSRSKKLVEMLAQYSMDKRVGIDDKIFVMELVLQNLNINSRGTAQELVENLKDSKFGEQFQEHISKMTTIRGSRKYFEDNGPEKLLEYLSDHGSKVPSKDKRNRAKTEATTPGSAMIYGATSPTAVDDSPISAANPSVSGRESKTPGFGSFAAEPKTPGSFSRSDRGPATGGGRQVQDDLTPAPGKVAVAPTTGLRAAAPSAGMREPAPETGGVQKVQDDLTRAAASTEPKKPSLKIRIPVSDDKGWGR